MKRNLFIAFEGIDGSGKSTQVKLLTQRLINNGHKVYSTFEPTDNPVGSLIRNIMKGRVNADHNASCEKILIYFLFIMSSNTSFKIPFYLLQL